jgi:hypothetical protein
MSIDTSKIDLPQRCDVIYWYLFISGKCHRTRTPEWINNEWATANLWCSMPLFSSTNQLISESDCFRFWKLLFMQMDIGTAWTALHHPSLYKSIHPYTISSLHQSIYPFIHRILLIVWSNWIFRKTTLVKFFVEISRCLRGDKQWGWG